METGEKKVILQLFDYLCANTTATMQILTLLLSEEVLTQHEFEEIEAIPSNYNQTKKLYDTIIKKNISMDFLIKALRDTCNNHIADKLEKQMESKNPISQAEAMHNDRYNLERILRPMMNYLCENTTNLSRLAVILNSRCILTSYEREEIEYTLTQYGRASRLYQLCMKKNVRPDVLIEALEISGNEHIIVLIEKQLFMYRSVMLDSYTMEETSSSKIEKSDELMGQHKAGVRNRVTQNIRSGSISSVEMDCHTSFKNDNVRKPNTRLEQSVTSSGSSVSLPKKYD